MERHVRDALGVRTNLVRASPVRTKSPLPLPLPLSLLLSQPQIPGARVPSGGCRVGVLRRGGGRYEREAVIGKDILDVVSGQSRPVFKQVSSLEPPCKRGGRVGWEQSGSRAL